MKYKERKRIVESILEHMPGWSISQIRIWEIIATNGNYGIAFEFQKERGIAYSCVSPSAELHPLYQIGTIGGTTFSIERNPAHIANQIKARLLPSLTTAVDRAVELSNRAIEAHRGCTEKAEEVAKILGVDPPDQAKYQHTLGTFINETPADKQYIAVVVEKNGIQEIKLYAHSSPNIPMGVLDKILEILK